MTDLERAMRTAVAEVNKATAVSTKYPAGTYDFVRLSDKLAEAVVEAAEQNLTRAKNELELAKQHAEQIKGITTDINNKLMDTKSKLETYGTKALDNHKEFLDGVIQPENPQQLLSDNKVQ